MSAELLRPNVKSIKYEDDVRAIKEIRVILYARYSCDQQSQTSITDQFRNMEIALQRSLVKSLLFPGAKFVIVFRYSDEAVSGFLASSEGYDAAIQALETDEADVILVDTFKRFSRGMQKALTTHDLLVASGKELIATSDNFSSAMPNARLQFMSRAYAGEEYIEGISAETSRALTTRRWDGFSDGHLWFGVGSKPTRQIMVGGKLKDSYFEYYVIPHLAVVVVRIFEMTRNGFSQNEIAKIFNAEHVPTPSAYDKHGQLLENMVKAPVWVNSLVWRMLNNRSYLGVIERGKTKVVRRANGTKHVIQIPRSAWIVVELEGLRIISQELWDAAHGRIKEFNRQRLKAVGDTKKPFRHDGQTNHVLSGLCACGECGGSVTVITAEKGGFYGCKNAYRAGTCTNRKLIRCTKLELPLLQWLITSIKNDEICKAIATKYNEQRRTRSQGSLLEVEKVDAQLANVEARIKNINDAIETAPGSKSLAGRLLPLELEEEALRNKAKFLRGIDASEIYTTPATIRQRFEEIPAFLQKAQPFEVNRALKPLFNGKGGVKLIKRKDENDKEHYWVVGSLNAGRVFGLADPKNGLMAENLALSIPLELKID